MRISFKLTQSSNILYLKEDVKYYGIINRLFPSPDIAFEDFDLENLKTYTDDSRYILNLYKVNFERKFANEKKAITENFISKSSIQVFHLNLNFDMDFEFELFNKSFVNYWKSDIEIETIKPLVFRCGSMDSPYFAFRSLATSFFAKMVRMLKTNNIMCIKKDNKIFFAYALDHKCDEAKTNDLVKLFANAVYEMVKVTSGRGNYEIPESVRYNIIDIEEDYAKRRSTNNTNASFIYETNMKKIK
ncbi:MAG: hypothetical protein ACRC4L_02005 [Mycoplasma sp.]